MAHHNYNTRGNSVQEDDSTPSMLQKLEEKLLSRMDGLSAEIINMKDVIIKNLQIDNEKLRKKVDFLENKLLPLKRMKTSWSSMDGATI